MKYDVFGIGNALVDMEFKVNEAFLDEHKIEKGLMTLVEEERQFQIVKALSDQDQHEVKRQCGGSAANTMIAISQFGGKSFYSFKIADDDMGHFYLDDIKENGIGTKNKTGQLADGVTGKCIVMVTEDAERTMNTYLGITAALDEDQIDEEALQNSAWVYVEGYLVASPTAQAAAVKTLALAKKHGVKRSVTMSDPNMVNFFKDNMKQLISFDLDLLFCNEQEALDFTGKFEINEAREELKKFAKHFVITLGDKGAVIWDGEQYINIASHKVETLDTNGAGDMFAGAFLYGINNGLSYEEAGNLASLASAKVVSQYGPRLESEQVSEVKKQLA
ncbi:adenosine kinase [Alteromonas sp. a30]|uniref:adenosine kinase n=1 Tax=Alteromonas sp. a30 TaxID=2730917 RepID=UPI002282B839|nr:adenosine kinase [Alteromonas sp. a30]MCY7293996.1 adenosine kinase [Alteromonas sp. a30]